MSLNSYKVSAQIAVSDMAQAEEFYEGRLGLSPDGAQHEGVRTYAGGRGTSLFVYQSPARAGSSTATLARWDVEDIEQTVDELTADGVTFEHYDGPLKTDAKGIHDSGYGRVAWFKDPDGNTFALEEV